MGGGRLGVGDDGRGLEDRWGRGVQVPCERRCVTPGQKISLILVHSITVLFIALVHQRHSET